MEVAPEKAKERRETAAKTARVERWAEDSGNAALMGRELPPDEVLAADQRITAWAQELRKAGLEGGMDELRARAFLDLVLGKDSRPRAPRDAPGRDGAPGAARRPRPGGGFAGRVTLTVPLATLLGLDQRPGEMSRHRPHRPLARRRPSRRGRAEPQDDVVRDRDRPARPRRRPRLRPARTRSGRPRAGPPGRRARDGPGFTFTPTGQDGPPGGYGSWRLCVPGGGPALVAGIDPVTTDPCDHRLQARGHDPGVKLRHLSQVRHATCTSPVCRRPAAECDFEHNVPYEAGGRTCLCNGGPKCRHDHRLKQQPGWTVDQLPDGTFRWTTPAGRSYDTEPTRYPILGRAIAMGAGRGREGWQARLRTSMMLM